MRPLSILAFVSASLAPTLAQDAPAAAAKPPYVSKPYTIPSRGVSKAIREAVESPDRPANMVERDGWRRPAEILALADIRPGNVVVELSSYPMYYAPMLSKVVGDKGKVYMYDLPVFASLALEEDEEITFNGGTHDEAIRMRFEDWKKLAQPRMVRLARHE